MSVDLSSSDAARASPFIASAGDLVYLWGGKGDTEPEAVFLFRRDTETWTRRRTRGPHPPAGLHNGGCCVSGQHLYIYGGNDGVSSRHGVLYELNTNSWTWRQLSLGDADGPGKKDGCRMIPYQNQLLVVGGNYGCSKVAGNRKWRTNEVHFFNLMTGLWSSPLMKGSRPPSCDRFSLTVTDEDQAVMFGGNTQSDFSSEVYILHLPTMTWTKYKEGDLWPEEREDHIAACLGYEGQHKTVLISGGGWDGEITLDDMWLLDSQSGRMEELQVPEKYKKLIQRYGHGTASLTVNSDCVEVILFGGCDNRHFVMADTTILRFVRQASAPEGVSPAMRWILTAVDEIKKKKDAGKAVEAKKNYKKKSTQEEIVTEEIESELLKEYPQLPVARQNEELCPMAPQRSTTVSSTSSETDGCTTSNLDLDQVLEEVIDAKTKWKFIGLKLGVPKGELDAIQCDGSSVGEKLMETLDRWLQSGRNTTWKALAEAMGAATVGREDLKQKILSHLIE